MDIFDPSEFYNLSKEPVDRICFDKIREWLHCI